MSSPPWALVKLRVAFGDVPPTGATLRMRTGRRYLVIKVGGAKTLHCLVLPPDEPSSRPVIDWQWAPRRQRRHKFRAGRLS